MPRICKIAVENAAYAFDKLYSYLLPEELDGLVAPGCRVTVPFGGGNRARTGIVVELGEAESTEKLKPVTAALDASPLLDDEGLALLRYLKEQTFCTWFDALRLLIPAGIGVVRSTVYSLGGEPKEGMTPLQEEIVAFLRGKKRPATREELDHQLNDCTGSKDFAALLAAGIVVRGEKSKQRIQDDKVIMVRLPDDHGPARLTPKQRMVVAFLEENEAVSLKELCYYTGVTRAVADGLERKGLVEYFEAVRLRSPFAGEVERETTPPALSTEQEAAFGQLARFAGEEKPAPALLYGVTGSGKTQVFMKLIEHVTVGGRDVLVLVPEISLTAQAVDGFRRRFGDMVAVLHSALSLGERMDEWKRIRQGGARVVVGTRSAVLAPLHNIGRIGIDEEQEQTYQSDKSPRFHARDVALRRCAHHGALLLMASATPSLESFYLAKQGRYRLVTLEERFGAAELPDVYVVDMREQGNVSANPAFSQRLLEEMRYNLEHGEQSILLLNRRGYSTVIKCSACGTVAECESCSVAMTFHAANDMLMCHYCGHSRPRPRTCEHCGSELIRYAGSGTQKLEEELGVLFPDARILRVDMDTTMAKFSHERLFAAFAAHEYDIMIGTQMVAKGLNFSRVTLVGVLSADQALYAGDFRSYERSFSLLTQVVGRCGRGDRRGRAFIQTFSPEHPVIQLSSHQDYPAFYTQEIQSRKLHLYPPFCVMAGVGFVGENVEEVRRQSQAFLVKFRELASAEYPGLPIRALGPVPSEVLKVAGKYRYKLLLKCRNTADTRQLLARMLEWFYGQCKTVSVYIDMHEG